MRIERISGIGGALLVGTIVHDACTWGQVFAEHITLYVM